MRVNLYDYLTENPNYLIAALVMAANGDKDILVELIGDEGTAFNLLRLARAHADNLKSHPAEGFPISLSKVTGEVIKMPERLAGVVLAGHKWFWSMESTAHPVAAVDISKLGEGKIAKLSSENKKMLDRLSPFVAADKVAPQSPGLPARE